MRGVMTNGFGRVFGFESFESEEILHGEFELCFAILTASPLFVYTHSLLERGHGVEDGVDDDLTS